MNNLIFKKYEPNFPFWLFVLFYSSKISSHNQQNLRTLRWCIGSPLNKRKSEFQFKKIKLFKSTASINDATFRNVMSMWERRQFKILVLGIVFCRDSSRRALGEGYRLHTTVWFCDIFRALKKNWNIT